MKGSRVIPPLALLLAWPLAASAQEPATTFSPRWMYELKGGYFYPDLDDYDVFYGDDRDTSVGVSGSYRLRDWLEVGGEIGHMRDKGVGIATGSGDPGAEVTLRLVPLHVFATFIYQPDPGRRLVPYAGVGLSATWYEQDIQLQAGRDGRTDVGPALRAGVRWFLTSEGPHTPPSPDAMYWRSYVFFEAQNVETEIDDIDLGGTSYLLGFRIEFELGR